MNKNSTAFVVISKEATTSTFLAWGNFVVLKYASHLVNSYFLIFSLIPLFVYTTFSSINWSIYIPIPPVEYMYIMQYSQPPSPQS